MIVFVRILAIIFIGMTASLSAVAQDDLEALSRRLTELEAEQAKSQATIEALRAQLEAMAAAKDDQPAAQLADEAGPVMADVPDDTGPQQSSASKLWGDKNPAWPELADESRFILRTEDESFEFGIDGLITGRWEINHRRDDGTGSSETDQGFETVGTRINFKGYVYDDFGYWVRLAGDEFGDDPVFDAIIGYYTFNEDTTLVLGSVPSILNRENGLPQDKLLGTESTATNYAFDPFGFKGVMLAHHTPRMIFRGNINDGYRSFANSAFDAASADWAVQGQVLGMAVGGESDWSRFNNFTSRRGNDFVWQLNAAFHLQDGSGDAGDTEEEGSDDVFLVMLESSMEGDGWNLYASGYYRDTDGPSTDQMSFDDWGYVLMGGAWVSKHVEWYAKYDEVISDSDRPVENDDFRTVSTGFNFYPMPHTDNIRLGVEALYMFDAEADSIVEPNTFNSIQASPSGDQWVIRSQGHLRW